jgi:CheY-like chemotaxis protein
MMGGKLIVESVLGIGSKFSFDLTFDAIDKIEDSSVKPKYAVDAIEKPAFDAEVLVCEDNIMNQNVICEHLERVGVRTVVAENGKMGLDEVESRMEKGEKQFDLIFMDMQMPVMDGFEAAAAIMKLNLGIPIVAMTANVLTSDVENYRRSGMNDCVGKPFTSQELWHCLLKYLTPLSMENGGKRNSADKEDDDLENDENFIKSIKMLFAKSNQNKFDEITKSLETGDIVTAHRLVHTLKSNAGQIGKTGLQHISANIEYLLKDGQNNASAEDLNILKTELSSVLDELSPLLKEIKTELS